MTLRESLNQVLEKLPDEVVSEVLDFARFLSWQEDRQDWQQFGQSQFSRAYGPEEPAYTEADIKPELTQ